jgi:hypothetical protein
MYDLFCREQKGIVIDDDYQWGGRYTTACTQKEVFCTKYFIKPNKIIL